jgi:hypothetical protein
MAGLLPAVKRRRTVGLTARRSTRPPSHDRSDRRRRLRAGGSVPRKVHRHCSAQLVDATVGLATAPSLLSDICAADSAAGRHVVYSHHHRADGRAARCSGPGANVIAQRLPTEIERARLLDGWAPRTPVSREAPETACRAGRHLDEPAICEDEAEIESSTPGETLDHSVQLAAAHWVLFAADLIQQGFPMPLAAGRIDRSKPGPLIGQAGAAPARAGRVDRSADLWGPPGRGEATGTAPRSGTSTTRRCSD